MIKLTHIEETDLLCDSRSHIFCYVDVFDRSRDLTYSILFLHKGGGVGPIVFEYHGQQRGPIFFRAKSIMASRVGYAEAKAFLLEVQLTLFKEVGLLRSGPYEFVLQEWQAVGGNE